MSIWHFFNPLVDAIFPPRCPVCGERLAVQSGLCVECWATLIIPASPSCEKCSRPFRDNMLHLGDGQCAPCMADPPSHAGVSAATLYNETSRKLVLAFKHGGKISLAPLMARLLQPQLPQIDSDWVIVPVPLHRWRLWKRGYNQSAELARALSKLCDGRLCVDALERRKMTPSLGGLGNTARKQVLEGAISVHKKRKLKLAGAKILLVDDVLTTGATTNACISALKRAGAETVRIACFARVLDNAL